MSGYDVISLKSMLTSLSEDKVKEILSSFSCTLNRDVEDFLRNKAILLCKQDVTQTHLVFTSYRDNPVLVGYFSLVSKNILFDKHKMSATEIRIIRRYAYYDVTLQRYVMSAPLIAQLGKNSTDDLGRLITGDELLQMALEKIAALRLIIGGCRYVYVECSDKPALIQFYERAGFRRFHNRPLEKSEENLDEDPYLVQMIKYCKDQ